jgi:hypothetical protein
LAGGAVTWKAPRCRGGEGGGGAMVGLDDEVVGAVDDGH